MLVLFVAAMFLNLSADGASVGVAQMPDKIAAVDTSFAEGGADPEARELGQRHLRLMEQAVAAEGAAFAQPIQFSVVTLPAFSNAKANLNAPKWPPSMALVSPWLAIAESAAGVTEMTLFVSDLRVMADMNMLGRQVDPEAFLPSGDLQTISYHCLADSSAAYVGAVEAGEEPEMSVLAGGCVPSLQVPHLFELFKSSPQVFFAPFDMAVLGQMKANRDATEPLYLQLYTDLVREGAAAFQANAGENLEWWHPAVQSDVR